MDKYEEVLVKIPRFTSEYEKELNKKGEIEQSDELYQLFKDQVLLTAWHEFFHAVYVTEVEFTVAKALKQLAEDYSQFRKKIDNGERPPSEISDEAWKTIRSKKIEKKTKRKRMTREEFLNESK